MASAELLEGSSLSDLYLMLLLLVSQGKEKQMAETSVPHDLSQRPAPVRMFLGLLVDKGDLTVVPAKVPLHSAKTSHQQPLPPLRLHPFSLFMTPAHQRTYVLLILLMGQKDKTKTPNSLCLVSTPKFSVSLLSKTPGDICPHSLQECIYKLYLSVYLDFLIRVLRCERKSSYRCRLTFSNVGKMQG